MTQNMNQFSQGSVRGRADLGVGGQENPVIQGRISANESGTLYPGDFVKLDTAITIPGLPSYLKAGVSDVAHGVILYDPAKSIYVKGDVLSIGLSGTTFVAIADVNTTPGVKVESVANGNMQVKGSNSTRGISLDYGVAGGHFRVLFKPEAL